MHTAAQFGQQEFVRLMLAKVPATITTEPPQADANNPLLCDWEGNRRSGVARSRLKPTPTTLCSATGKVTVGLASHGAASSRRQQPSAVRQLRGLPNFSNFSVHVARHRRRVRRLVNAICMRIAMNRQ